MILFVHEHTLQVLLVFSSILTATIEWFYKICEQYRSEISGLRTRKTHAQFLRKRVLKNACQNTRLRAFARIWCACFLLLFTLITVLCVAFFYTTKEKDKRQFLQTPLRNISAEKQTADSHGVGVQSLIIDKCHFYSYFCYGLNVNENNPSHRFSVLLACGVAVWISSLLPG